MDLPRRSDRAEAIQVSIWQAISQAGAAPPATTRVRPVARPGPAAPAPPDRRLARAPAETATRLLRSVAENQ
jgi:hypothetical protein